MAEHSEQRKKIKSKRRELREVREELRAAENLAETLQQQRRKKTVQHELFQLERELRAAEERWAGDEPVTGALPDFAIIGIGKGGTTFLYHLLTQHPYVEPAAAKEPHFFDNLFDLGVEWYRKWFPTPRWKDGRRTITGEATPYMPDRRAPERMAEVVPEARLIALLRNPVDRAYSRYQKQVRHGMENRKFDEVIEAEKAWLETRTFEGTAEAEKARQLETYLSGYSFDVGAAAFGYLSTSFYVDHLLHWSRFFGKEQLLVLKSEDLFGRPQETLKVILGFLDLPEWEPEASQLQEKRNTRQYERMAPATRSKLEEYFEPHNRRLYNYLGVNLGW